MNKFILKRCGTLILVLALYSSVSFSQLSDQFDKLDFLKSAPADGSKLLKAYMAPWINAFGAGLNGSWYNTAKPHKLGGFDITTGINVGMVPESDLTFDLSKIGLSSGFSPLTGSAPTIAGATTSGPKLTYSTTVPSVGSVALASFNTPPGTGIKFVPVPTAQIGIGLPLGTEVKVRYLPKIPIKDGNVSLWGVGLVHSIMQYIPGNELLPLDVSLFGGYTKFMAYYPINLQPESSIPQSYSPAVSFADQSFKATVSALNVSAIVSVNLPVITFYGGVGYSKTSTEFILTGNFPTPTVSTTDLNSDGKLNDPVYTNSGVIKGESFPDLKIDNFSGLRGNVGFRLKFAVITLHFDYTRAQYNIFSTGLGISFR